MKYLYVVILVYFRSGGLFIIKKKRLRKRWFQLISKKENGRDEDVERQRVFINTHEKRIEHTTCEWFRNQCQLILSHISCSIHPMKVVSIP